MRPQSVVTEKHKLQRLVFNPANQNLAFGVAAQSIFEQIMHPKMPPHIKKSKKQAHLENCTYKQTVSHLEKELQLNCFEALDELQKDTVTQQATKSNPEKPKLTCHHSKKPGHYLRYRSQCRLIRKKYKAESNKFSARINKNSNNNSSKKL